VSETILHLLPAAAARDIGSSFIYLESPAGVVVPGRGRQPEL